MEQQHGSSASAGAGTPVLDTGVAYTQSDATAAETTLAFYLQKSQLGSSDKIQSSAAGSPWWVQSSAAADRAGHYSHRQAPRQRESCSRSHCSAVLQASSVQHTATQLFMPQQEAAMDEDAAAVAALDGLLESLEVPSLTRAMPPPMPAGHRKSARLSWDIYNGGGGRRAALGSPEAGHTSLAAPVHDAKHVSMLSALHSAPPAGLAELWKEASQVQSTQVVYASTSAASGSQVHVLNQHTPLVQPLLSPCDRTINLHCTLGIHLDSAVAALSA